MAHNQRIWKNQSMQGKKFIPIAILLFWAGFVSSISFMEAWVKFRADGVTLPVGLSIGMKVFTALNRVEWVLLALFLATLLTTRSFTNHAKVITAIVVVMLGLQTFWLLPDLSERAIQIIQGNQPEGSATHMLFGVAEITKVVTLIAGSWILARK